MIIAGIDHGTIYGMAALNNGKIKTVHSGELNNSSKLSKSKRLYMFANAIGEFLDNIKPDLVVLERPSDKKNGYTSEILIGYYSMELVECYKRNIDIIEAYPTSVKLKIAGIGTATKDDVALALKDVFNKDFRVPIYYQKNTRDRRTKEMHKSGELRGYRYDMSDAVALAYYGLLIT